MITALWAFTATQIVIVLVIALVRERKDNAELRNQVGKHAQDCATLKTKYDELVQQVKDRAAQPIDGPRKVKARNFMEFRAAAEGEVMPRGLKERKQ